MPSPSREGATRRWPGCTWPSTASTTVATVRAALAATDRARALAERGRLFGRRDRVVERDLARRVPRLRRRLAAMPPAACEARSVSRALPFGDACRSMRYCRP